MHLTDTVRWVLFAGILALLPSTGIADGSEEEDPVRVMYSFQYGVYENPVQAEQTITPEFLRSLEVTDRYFVDAVRLFLATDEGMVIRMPHRLSPVGKLILEELTRRGDALTPLLIEFMSNENENPFCPMQFRILAYMPSVLTLDLQPFLEYVRDYIRAHPDEVPNRLNVSNYGGVNTFLSIFGEEEDVALLKSRQEVGGGLNLSDMLKRLAKEKETGITAIEKRRHDTAEIRAKYGLSQLAATKTNPPAQSAAVQPPNNAPLWLWVALAFVVLAVALGLKSRLRKS